MEDNSLALCLIEPLKEPGEQLNLVKYNELAVKGKTNASNRFQELLVAKRQKNSALYKNKKLKIEINEISSEIDELKGVLELEKQKCSFYEMANKELRQQLAQTQLDLEREKGRKNFFSLRCRELRQELDESRSALEEFQRGKQELEQKLDCLLEATEANEERTVSQLQVIIESSHEFMSKVLPQYASSRTYS